MRVLFFLSAFVLLVAKKASSEQLSLEWMQLNGYNTEADMRNSTLCTGKPDGFYSFDGNCNPGYYACVSGNYYEQTCPGTENVFDPATSTCVSQDQASCFIQTTTTTTTTTTTVNPLACPADGFYPLGNCSQSYYACVSGDLYPQLCPGNGVFDATVSACVSPETAGCSTTTASTTTSVTTSPQLTTTLEPMTATESEIATEPMTTIDPMTTSEPEIATEPFTTIDPMTTSEPMMTTEPMTNTELYTNTEPMTTIEPTMSTEPTSTELVTEPAPFCPATGTHYYPLSTTECSQSYYTCVDGQGPFVQDCTSINVFDTATNQCSGPPFAECNQPFCAVGETSNRSIADNYCSNWYVRCVDGILQSGYTQCPLVSGGSSTYQTFEPSIEECVDPADAPCRNPPTTTVLPVNLVEHDVLGVPQNSWLRTAFRSILERIGV